MKKLAIGVLSFALLLPAPAEALFGSECRSLKKRTQANQVKYEKAWDRYQTTKAQFIASKPDTYSIVANNPIIPRYIVLGEIQISIIEDFVANKKCLSKNNKTDWSVQIKTIKGMISKPSGWTVTNGDGFSQQFNFMSVLK
jgi:hypothetical protein